MERRVDRGPEEEDPSSATTTPENTAGSPLSGDEEIHAPSVKKSRKGTKKRVVTVSLGDGVRSKTEVQPPQDPWSWRKYGQKPIKGSPYPRGYYRCSSSKGCPARKQVERSRHDPTAVMITYTCEHNHPLSTPAVKPHHLTRPLAPPMPEPGESGLGQGEEETAAAEEGFAEFVGEFGWVCEVGSTMMDETTFVGPSWVNADVERFMPIGEEDKLLFGDLGDLPEYSVVFRRCVEETTFPR